MMFAAANFLPQSINYLGQVILENLPEKPCSTKDLAQFLALVHNEFNAIHPFREGNGRTIRLFLDLMALSFDHDFVDYETFEEKTYINACIEGVKGNHKPMEEIMLRGLKCLN